MYDRHVEELVCHCGCTTDLSLTTSYDADVADLRKEMADVAARATRLHELVSDCGCGAAEAFHERLSYVAEQLMRRADRDICRRRAAVLATATACLLELSRNLD